MEDEIDLAQYARTVFKHWKLTLGITLAAVITAGIVSFATPPVYEARALLKAPGEDSEKQMAELAKSDSTAEYMLRALADNLTPAERSMAGIKNIFKIDAGQTYFTCTARYPDSEKAAQLANAWAAAFIEYATDVYLNSLMPAAEMQAQIDSSYAFYREAQAAYDSFQLTSQIAEISRRITDANLLYQALQLQDSLSKTGGADDAASLAFLYIKIKSYTTLPDATPLTAGTTAPVSKADVDALVRELEDRSGIHGKTAGQVLMEMNALRAGLEQESQRGSELSSARDTAWSSYLAAIQAEERLNIQRNAMIAPVRQVGYATPPQDPAPSNRLMNIGIALVLGLILGVIAAFTAEYIEKRRPAPAAKQAADNKPRQE
ncbi:MAG: Wzz/FepE/Etk N-terminal domain-containing protein [Dehalococcoidia bacterium]